MATTMTRAEVAEGVRAAIATYTQALDDGRTDDVVATFCPEGVCQIPGLGTHRGHDGSAAPTPHGSPPGPSGTWSSTPWSPSGVTPRPPRSATWSSSSWAGPVGRSSWWAATATPCTTAAARGDSTIAPPPS